jgi:hypothetical protein
MPCKTNRHILFHILVNQLTQIEAIRRCSNSFTPAFDIVNHNPLIPSFLREKYQLFYSDLIERLKVDMTILDYNYTRLTKYITMVIEEQIRVFVLRRNEVQLIEELEYSLALEFFLQFDGMFHHRFRVMFKFLIVL